jgi:HSP20 family protein
MTQELGEQLGRWRDQLGSFGETFTPLADVEEADDAYTVEVELPGVKKSDISIELAGRRVTIAGERHEKERRGVLRRRTRKVGQFRYEVVLPGDFDESQVTASLKEGVLTVRLPKSARERPRRITVS